MGGDVGESKVPSEIFQVGDLLQRYVATTIIVEIVNNQDTFTFLDAPTR